MKTKKQIASEQALEMECDELCVVFLCIDKSAG